MIVASDEFSFITTAQSLTIAAGVSGARLGSERRHELRKFTRIQFVEIREVRVYYSVL